MGGRIFLAGLLGGVVFFLWGFVAHMVLPLGMMGMQMPSDSAQTGVLDSMKSNFQGGDGVYLLPMMSPEQWSDEAKSKAFGERQKTLPSGFVVYHSQGLDVNEAFTPLLVKQGVADILSALLAAFIVSFAAVGFGMRVVLVTLLGVFSWLTISVPYWNWYRFPTDFTVGNLLEQLGWAFAGIAIAWVLGRKRA